MGRVCSCVLIQMTRSAVTKSVKSCDLLLSQICLFNAHTFTKTLFLRDAHCPILFTLGSTPSTSPLMLTLTLEGTFRMLVYKITELSDYQTLLFPSLPALALELESLLQLSAFLHNSYGLITLFFGICSWLGGFRIIHSLPGPIPTQVLQLSLVCLIHTYSETNEDTLDPSFIANVVCGFLCQLS